MRVSQHFCNWLWHIILTVAKRYPVTVKYIATTFEIVEPVKNNLLGCDAGAVVCGLTTAAKASSSLRPLSIS